MEMSFPSMEKPVAGRGQAPDEAAPPLPPPTAGVHNPSPTQLVVAIVRPRSRLCHTVVRDMARYRMIAIDLDGTLLSPTGQVTPRAKQAVQRALNAGLLVCFATGRNWTES